MLSLAGVTASYGPIRALHGVSLQVADGQVVALLGANGAGKTSTLRVISGLLRPEDGRVEYEGRRVEHRAPQDLVRLGISHVPEGRELFPELTVEENLRIGAYVRGRDGIKRDQNRVLELFPRLAARRTQPANSLSGGEQQMLAIGRALMSGPRLLLLDEPSLGLAPVVVRDIFQTIRTINEQEKMAMLVVEQNVALALSVADYGYVLQTGKVALADTSEHLLQDENVRRSYLGY